MIPKTNKVHIRIRVKQAKAQITWAALLPGTSLPKLEASVTAACKWLTSKGFKERDSFNSTQLQDGGQEIPLTVTNFKIPEGSPASQRWYKNLKRIREL